MKQQALPFDPIRVHNISLLQYSWIRLPIPHLILLPTLPLFHQAIRYHFSIGSFLAGIPVPVYLILFYMKNFTFSPLTYLFIIIASSVFYRIIFSLNLLLFLYYCSSIIMKRDSFGSICLKYLAPRSHIFHIANSMHKRSLQNLR